MKLRLGYVGVEDTMEQVLSVIRSFPELHCLPLIHTSFEEIPGLLELHKDRVDAWLFSGPLPYQKALQAQDAGTPMYYIPYSGIGLYRTLCRIFYDKQLGCGELSFDLFEPRELKQIFKELGMEQAPLHLIAYTGSDAELVEFHHRLWKEGHTQAAVTCVWLVQQKLEALGVPVYRVTPTDASIEGVLHAALRNQETLRFKEAQVAVQLMEADPFAGLTKEMFSTDELYRKELDMTRELLSYAKLVQGSLKPAGSGRFAVFTTRGAISEATRRFTALPELLTGQDSGAKPFRSGIGIGRSVYEAEILAGKALLHAREQEDGAWMVLLEDKTILGPLGKPEQLSYSSVSQDLQAASDQSSLSVATLSKIESVLGKLGSDELSAHELAQHLQIMPRSARRILIQLEAAGFAEIIGEDTPHPRGRPRKRYRLRLEP